MITAKVNCSIVLCSFVYKEPDAPNKETHTHFSESLFFIFEQCGFSSLLVLVSQP